ncbi:hypothetical protein BD413DRAFT_482736 [Trametes elegans]|nr:hypothetical protein BD413DRAFT_482736 [Trametes elegans]
MATAAVLSPQEVPTTLNYYTPLNDEKPYNYSWQNVLPEGTLRSNVGREPHPVVVHNARGREAEFGLDKNGFQFVTWPSKEKAFDDEERIQKEYYPEVEELLKTVTGAKRVFIFDHTISQKPGSNERGPAQLVHIDQTYQASVNRVRYHLPDDADRLLQSRVRLINVWRPIHHTAAHKPLAVSDWRFLDESKDLVPVRLIYPHREGSTYSVRYNPDHKWYYLADQTPDEVTLIKCYDSETDRARLTPHSAFEDPTSPKDAPNRHSIEIRALVFDAE